MARPPHLIVLAGPNGAGKSTAAPALIGELLGVGTFVNADVIARGLAGFRPEEAAMSAGRLMLDRLHDLARARATFAFETTLASRSFAPWIAELVEDGYLFDLFFLWLPSPAQAIARVEERVRLGGHSVPEATIERRYRRGLDNFFGLYAPMASSWLFCDNSSSAGPRVLASGGRDLETEVTEPMIWKRIRNAHER